jgi:hypothetical protein
MARRGLMMTGAFRSLFECALLRGQAGWSYMTRTPFSPVFWLPMSFTAQALLIPTVFGA